MSEGREAIKAICAIMGSVTGINKAGFNDFHKYKFTAVEDVMKALQKQLADNGLTVIPHEVEREFMHEGRVLAMTFEFHVVHSSGDTLSPAPRFTGMCGCLSKNGAFDDKAANKCLVGAQKYFLLQLFKIPTGDYPDADHDGDVDVRDANGEVAPPKPPKRSAKYNECRSALWAAAGIEARTDDDGFNELADYPASRAPDAVDDVKAAVESIKPTARQCPEAERIALTELKNNIIEALEARFEEGVAGV